MKTTIQFGPQHPILHEPLHLKLTLDGEIVEDVEMEVGFAHRGLEKKMEWDYNRALYVAERVCGICTQHHSTCYCLAVEGMMNIELPRRARIIRTIMLELERLHSHLLAAGLTMETIGFENLCMLSFRNREMVLDVFERTTGNRVIHGVNVVGGVTRDITPEMAKEISGFCDAIEKRCHDLEEMIVKSYTIRQRMQGVGVLGEQLARDLCVVGPIARGSNIPYDIRAEAPYLLYKEVKVTPIVETTGDCWARTMVRLRELYQSIDIIRQCLPLLEEAPGEIFVKPDTLPDGENFARVEPPRGELFYYVKGKKSRELDRVKIRTSTYANGMGIVPVIKGAHFSDIGMITMTFDPCIGCFDR
jgi:ech hydrogenase subunit E